LLNSGGYPKKSYLALLLYFFYQRYVLSDFIIICFFQEGIINSLRISTDHKTIVAAVGQENRLGRWMVNKKTRNGILVLRIGDKEIESSSEESSSDESSSGSE
jgi:hypothetical protein